MKNDIDLFHICVWYYGFSLLALSEIFVLYVPIADKMELFQLKIESTSKPVSHS